MPAEKKQEIENFLDELDAAYRIPCDDEISDMQREFIARCQKEERKWRAGYEQIISQSTLENKNGTLHVSKDIAHQKPNPIQC